MDAELCDLSHAFARLEWMREDDLRNSASYGMQQLGRREQWRVDREESLLFSVKNACRRIHSDITSGRDPVLLPSVKAIIDEGTAIACGCGESAVKNSPFRSLSPAALFDGSLPHAKTIATTSDEKIAAFQASNSRIVDEAFPIEGPVRQELQRLTSIVHLPFMLWERFAKSNPHDTDVNLELIVRKFLASRRSHWRTKVEVLQHHHKLDKSPPKGTSSGAMLQPSFIKETPEKAWNREPGQAMTALSSPPKLIYDVEPQGGPTPGHDRESLEYWGRAQSSWTSSAGEDALLRSTTKWQGQPALLNLVRYRGAFVAHMRRKRSALRSESHRLALKLCNTARREREDLRAYTSTATYLLREEHRCQAFFDSEEQVFEQQFNEYVAKMTKFYLHECPLDRGWVAKIENGDTPERRVVFVNTATGKAQLENPNMLKVVAAKNRQLMKANVSRQERIQAMRKHVDQINAIRQGDFAAIERRLQAPIVD